ncbi:MAG: FadR/GntR family transcriptional regulator [Terracidiphilus sp.]
MFNSLLTTKVVDHIRAKLENGSLKPGDRIPPERELAKILNMSRASLRTGIGYLVSIGVLKARRGAATSVMDGPWEIGEPSLKLLAALNGLEFWQILEVRKLLESNSASLAAERGKGRHFRELSEELADMYAAIGDPTQYLIHDMRFHLSIARASSNPILVVLVEAVLRALCDERRKLTECSEDRRLAMEEHREIYRAIRNGDPLAARAAMERHLHSSPSEWATEQLVARRRNKLLR